MNVDKLLPTNEHGLERVLRFLVGVVVLSLVFIGPKTYWGLLGLVPLVTGAIGSCPLYTLFGFSTCGVRPGGKRAAMSPSARI